MPEVIIYTDGACSGNPGPGGWGAILIYKDTVKEISGYEENTTNNRMELTAAIEALKMLKRPCKVNLYSDSSYLINAFNQKWIDNWLKKGWIKSDKTPVENKDLWLKLLDLSSIHQIKWIKVKGHADNEYNNRCDKLATDEIKKHQISIAK
ncbi:ribonuclease HI [Thermoanaerobacterium sp. R66]|uniref:ribonuclease HI n=1 Tax=Thermoanaerobacterium sp. R66 TaxID=2742479 RepID=UPI003314536E